MTSEVQALEMEAARSLDAAGNALESSGVGAPLQGAATRMSTGYGRRLKRCNAVTRVVIFGCLGMALFGYDTGVVSGAMVLVRTDITMDTDQAEHVVSITMLFAAIATVFGIPANSLLGRKPVIMFSAVLYIAGSVAVAAASSVVELLVGRAVLGVAIGFASGTVPMYSAELSPPDLRGMIVTLNDLNIVVGQLFAAMVNVIFRHYAGGWRWSMGFAALPATVLFVGVCFLPESPRWLAMKGRRADAEAVLRLLYDREDVSGPLEDILTAISLEGEEKDSKRGFGGLMKRGFGKLGSIWGVKEIRRAAVLGIGLMAMNQFSGINTVMYYSTTILVQAGFSQDASIWLAAMCCAAQLVGVCVSVASMDTAGRRSTALRSSFGVVLTLSLLAVSFMYKDDPLWDNVKVVALMLYLVAFGSGLSGVPWVINAEIYPLKLRSAAVGQATVSSWLFNYLVGRYFLTICALAGTSGAFMVFAGCSVVGGIWMYFMLPETMGLDLEEIDAQFKDPYPNLGAQAGNKNKQQREDANGAESASSDENSTSAQDLSESD
mmetsp:Transcript_174164/g.558473  ORF Transcript_174164/g.558473 Transcript_174164/m.558473 type:complete len:549 (+) Transcript_174164:65-1711(+)